MPVRREESMGNRKNRRGDSPPQVAGNGLIDRRALLGRGALIAGAIGTGVTTSLTGAAAEPLPVDPWSMEIGTAIPPYGQPATYEKYVVRTLTNPKNEPRTSQARTPHNSSTARSRRTVCISWYRAQDFPTLIRTSIVW